MEHRPDITYLQKYLNGELDARAMYELERQAEDDPMLMDMLRGLESSEAAVHEANLNDLAGRLQQRLGKPEHATKHIRPWKAWAIAASLVFFASIAGFWALRQPKEIPLRQEASSSPGQSAQKPLVPQPPAEEKVKQTVKKSNLVRRKEELLADLEPTEQTKNSRQDCTRILSEPRLSENRFAKPKAVSEPESFSKKDTLTPPAFVSEKLAGRVSGVVVRGVSSSGRDRHSDYISGVIKDSGANEPLAGAQITLKNTQTSAVSDKNGRFILNNPIPGKDTLQISQVGYETKELPLAGEPGANDLLIAMAPSTASLDEVVVVGYSAGKKPRKAEPAMGWKAYKKYLKDETSATGLNGKVTLVFNLDTQGKPVHIRILKSDDKSLDQPAIQLLRNGPVWTAGTKEGLQEMVHLSISF